MTSVRININTRVTLEADLAIPENALALVIFSHGSGSSRFSPRNNFVAQQLQRKGIATLLADLLTKQEDQLYSNRFNIPLLSERLISITNWVIKNRETHSLPIGYFGASTGAASALTAALQMPQHIKAIVSRGGRPDLAAIDFSQLKTPTLFLVGELDTEVMALHETVFEQLSCEKKLITIADATHLFEEPGTLEQVATLAADWFLHFLPKSETNNLYYHSTITQ
jgi:putative phosphoribosyl transferase